MRRWHVSLLFRTGSGDYVAQSEIVKADSYWVAVADAIAKAEPTAEELIHMSCTNLSGRKVDEPGVYNGGSTELGQASTSGTGQLPATGDIPGEEKTRAGMGWR